VTRLKYRTAWLRFCAGVVDGVVLMPLSLLIDWVGTKLSSPAALIPLGIVASGMGVVYSVLLHGRFGQTVGKRQMRVKVLDVSEAPLTVRQAVLRDAPMIVLAFVQIILLARYILGGGNPFGFAMDRAQPLGLLEYAMMIWFAAEVVTMLFNEKRRALHDWIAGSVVVRV
jgi:uncharacterized RDD family membrane protein YckC